MFEVQPAIGCDCGLASHPFLKTPAITQHAFPISTGQISSKGDGEMNELRTRQTGSSTPFFEKKNRSSLMVGFNQTNRLVLGCQVSHFRATVLIPWNIAVTTFYELYASVLKELNAVWILLFHVLFSLGSYFYQQPLRSSACSLVLTHSLLRGWEGLTHRSRRVMAGLLPLRCPCGKITFVMLLCYAAWCCLGGKCVCVASCHWPTGNIRV